MTLATFCVLTSPNLLGPISIPELPPVTQPSIPTLLHTIFPLLRLLVLVPLYPVLVRPRVKYVPSADIQDREGGAVDGRQTEDSSLLVPAEERAIPSQGLTPAAQSQYGTFRSTARSDALTTGSNTRSHTPVPGEGADGTQVSAFRCFTVVVGCN